MNSKQEDIRELAEILYNFRDSMGIMEIEATLESHFLVYGNDVKAQALKDVGEWLVGDCPHMNYQQRHLCLGCRRELIDTLKQGKLPEEEK